MTPTEQAARWLADVRPHKEQLDVWADELIADLAMSCGFDYQDYETKIAALIAIREKLELSADHCGDNALAVIARHLAPGDDLVEQATAALEGVTDGPWRVDGQPWNQIVWSGAENRVCFMAHSNGLDDDRDIATARFIAFASQWVPEAAARLSALTAEVAELTRERDTLRLVIDANIEKHRSRAETAEREAATLRDRLARMEGAATKIRGLIKYDLDPKSCEITASEDGEFVVYDHVSAALTDGGSNG